MEERFEEMHNAGLVPTPKMLVRYRTLIRDMEKKVIGKHYDVILATCNECAGYRLSNLRKTGRVAQVIVDECGMAYEPETIVAVSLSNHVVLIGDHKQLQPVIKLSAARENGLSTSLFQRYAENFKDKFPLITLKVQYRMVSLILITLMFWELLIYTYSIQRSVSFHQNSSTMTCSSPAPRSWNVQKLQPYGISGRQDHFVRSYSVMWLGKKGIHLPCLKVKKAVGQTHILRETLKRQRKL